MKTAKKVRQPAAERRKSLLQAALDLFSKQGYDGTTTRAIAERGGVTEALLFKHFRTKQELLRAVVEEFGPRRLFLPPDETIHSLPIRAALEVWTKQYLDVFWENRAFLRMLFMASERDRATFLELHLQFGKQALDLFHFLHSRCEQGELAPNSAVAVTDILSAATSGFLQRSLTDEPEQWETVRDHFVMHLLQILFDGIRPAASSV